MCAVGQFLKKKRVLGDGTPSETKVIEMVDVARLHELLDLRGEASFASTFVSSLDMFPVVVLLKFLAGCSPVFLASNASATDLRPLFPSG
jgi:hypothetical protein